MKLLRNKSPFAIVLGLGCALVHNSSEAAFKYWDNTGNSGNPTNGVWDTTTPNWSTTSALTATPTTFTAGDLPIFCAGTATAGSLTVTVNTPDLSANGVYNNGIGGFSCLLTLSGSGSLNMPAGANSFYVTAAKTTTVNIPITGVGAVQTGATGQLFLHGTNTFSGGFNVTSAGLVFFNNPYAFGTGPINLMSGGSGAAFVCEATSPITITNNVVLTAAYSYNFTCIPAGITYSGNWNLNGNTIAIGCGNNSTANLNIISGVISGTGGIGRQTSTTHGTLLLTGANTYSGKTSFQSSVTSVSSINSVTSPAQQPSSNLGVPSSAANGTLAIGSTTFAGTLLYTGPGETTDRIIDLAGTTGGAVIEADGTGPLVFTSANTASGAGAKTLTLQGSNTVANSIGKIVNSSSPTAVVKAQAGKWKLTGANTHTGGTTVSGGTLEISGSVAGSVTNSAGVLMLDTTTTMTSGATLAITSGATVNLNFSGAQAINALVKDGAPLGSGTWGATGSGAAHIDDSIFTGSGRINVLGTPVIVQQPASGSAFPDQSFTFTVGVADPTGMKYQWKQNGVSIANATDSTYTISPVEAANAGNYTVWVTNGVGFTNSVTATLMVLRTNAYTETIRGDFPISYWRLDETNGAFAFDAIGGNLGLYNNVLLNQTGYSLTDADPAIGLPGAAAGRGYVSVTNFTPFAFVGIPAFTLEGWAYFTNLTGIQRLFSTFSLTGGNGYAFGINGANGLRFTSGTKQDADITLGSSLVTGVWYHLVCTCDGSSYYFYVNGSLVGSVVGSGGNDGTSQPLTLGCNPVAYTNNNTGDPLGEQVRGRLDEVAVYGYQLGDAQVMNHYVARYSDAPLPVPATPVVTPPTNYQSLATTLQENAAGVNLSYQWYKAPSTLLAGQTSSAMTLAPLQLSDAGGYYVVITNNAGITNSPTNFVAVLPIPTNAAQLNLTNGLVLHLPFDGDYADISGRLNNGTNVGSTTFTTGAVGANALHYFSDAGSSNFNYVTLGVPPDLQFGASTDFTVAYWVRQPAGSTFTNLPFFGDEPIDAMTGFTFAPYATATSAGGWSEAIGSMSSPSAFTSFPDSDLINDGNWHLLVHSAQRTANIITYLDGVQVDSQAIGFLGSISTTTPANIGQDSSGTYGVTAEADIDDLAVWRRTLTPLEVSGMYLAGATNHVSFAPPVANPIVRVALQIQQVAPGQYQIVWTGPGTLTASGDVLGTYTNVPSASSPYPIPTSSGPQLFYRLKY